MAADRKKAERSADAAAGTRYVMRLFIGVVA